MFFILFFIRNAPYNAPKKKSDPPKKHFLAKNTRLQNTWRLVAVVIPNNIAFMFLIDTLK